MELKVEINDSPKYGGCKTILLDLEDLKLNLPETFEFEGETLYLKDEFHITLVGNEDSLIMKEKFTGDYLELQEKIEEIITEKEINFKKEFCVLKKEYSAEEVRYSVIQIIETEIIHEFRKMLKEDYCVILSDDVPEPHITLYKQKENRGIGLYSKDDLEKYCVDKLKKI